MGELLDVKGAFLHGDFENGERLYKEFSQGFEERFTVYVILLLLETLYGLKQAAMAFWRELLKAFRSMGFDLSKVDPCLYFKWTQHDLVVWVFWIDDCLVIGNAEGMKHFFHCDEVGNMDDYVGYKINRGDEEKGPYLRSRSQFY
jgi:hypothetical protein